MDLSNILEPGAWPFWQQDTFRGIVIVFMATICCLLGRGRYRQHGNPACRNIACSLSLATAIAVQPIYAFAALWPYLPGGSHGSVQHTLSIVGWTAPAVLLLTIVTAFSKDQQ